MAKFEDLTGKTFGLLTVIKRLPNKILPSGQQKTQYLCRCSCEKHTLIEVSATHLKDGHVQSCGCLNRELSSKRLLEREEGIGVKHGKYNTKIYASYKDMVERCTCGLGKGHDSYVVRNITICPEWYDPNASDTISIDKFREFYNWSMMNGFSDELTIDRIDPMGPYAPWNCRWATAKEQSNNTTVNRYVQFNGQQMTVGQFADILGVNYDWIYNSLYRVNFKPYDLFEWVQTPYGPIYTLVDSTGYPVRIHPIYYINQYGFPVSTTDYQPPKPVPALWYLDARGFVTGPVE